MTKYQSNRRRLLKEVICPHCWSSFRPEDVLWISEDLSLVGDDRLGESERVRFLPTEYDEYGTPLDARGTEDSRPRARFASRFHVDRRRARVRQVVLFSVLDVVLAARPAFEVSGDLHGRGSRNEPSNPALRVVAV